jgi:hypothetical protein
MEELWSCDKIVDLRVKHKAGECCCYVPEILTKQTG